MDRPARPYIPLRISSSVSLLAFGFHIVLELFNARRFPSRRLRADQRVPSDRKTSASAFLYADLPGRGTADNVHQYQNFRGLFIREADKHIFFPGTVMEAGSGILKPLCTG